MTYRKITVDGKVYEYTIGKTNTKIKGVAEFFNTDIGTEVKRNADGEPFDDPKYAVTPAIIEKLIRRHHLYSKTY